MISTIEKDERSTIDTTDCHQIDLRTKSQVRRGSHTKLGRINDPLDSRE